MGCDECLRLCSDTCRRGFWVLLGEEEDREGRSVMLYEGVYDGMGGYLLLVRDGKRYHWDMIVNDDNLFWPCTVRELVEELIESGLRGLAKKVMEREGVKGLEELEC